MTRNDPKSISGTSDLLLKLVDAFSQLPPSINRTEVATALFNKTGINMIPFLTMGTEELKKFMQQSDETGATVTTAQKKMSEQLTRDYAQITSIARGFTLELGHLPTGGERRGLR